VPRCWRIKGKKDVVRGRDGHLKNVKDVQEQERHDKPREEINSDRTRKLLLVQDTRRRIRIRSANSGSGDQDGRVG
jgi:hypothetical protein